MYDTDGGRSNFHEESGCAVLSSDTLPCQNKEEESNRASHGSTNNDVSENVKCVFSL